MLANLATPIGQLCNSPSQRFDRTPKVAAMNVDVATDLRRGAAGHANR